MEYLFGDATPFPLEENFLETLVAATDTCVALFAEENAEQERNRTLGKAKQKASEDLARLKAFSGSLEGAITPYLPEQKPATPCDEAALRISEHARQTIEEIREKVFKERDGTAESLKEDMPSIIKRRVADFFRVHQLPETEWTCRWWVDPMASSPMAKALIGATSPAMVKVMFETRPIEKGMWAGPLKMLDYDPELVVELEREAGLFRSKLKVFKEPLGKYLITEVDNGAEGKQLVLKATVKKASPGLRVSFSVEPGKSVTITPIDEDGNESGKSASIQGESMRDLELLWARIEKETVDLRGMRHSILSLRLGEGQASEAAQAGRLAETILQSIAPYVRQMRLRSRVPGELGLKRVLGDGRREELFVPREDLVRKYRDLTDHQRRIFDAMGISDEPVQPAAEEGLIVDIEE